MGKEPREFDMHEVLKQLEEDRRSGKLFEQIAKKSWVRYGISDDGSARIKAVDGVGRSWDYDLEEQVRKRIERVPPLTVIKLREQPEYSNHSTEMDGIFEWLERAGTLSHWGKDWYYRPKAGVLGPCILPQDQILKAIMSTNGKRTGYITGPVLYNRMGLTTQVPAVITIATMAPLDDLPPLRGLRIEIVAARVDFDGDADIRVMEILDTITDLVDDPALGSLDALSDVNDTMGKRSEKAWRFMRKYIQKQTDETKVRLKELAKAYPEKTRTLLEVLSNNSKT